MTNMKFKIILSENLITGDKYEIVDPTVLPVPVINMKLKILPSKYIITRDKYEIEGPNVSKLYYRHRK